MTDILAAGRDLYAALANGDADALMRLLAPRFVGHLCSGMPLGLGRTFDGLDSMMTDGWAALGDAFVVAPEPEDMIDGGKVLVVRGTYVGAARATGRPLRAAFIHLWGFDGQRFTSVRQVTDTVRWHEALTSR